MVSYMKWTDPITEEVKKKAEKELRETPEIRKKALEELCHLINNEDGFQPVMEAWFLTIFLRNKKYNVMKTFKNLKKFYEFKSMYSGTITDLKPTQFKKVYDMDVLLISPLRNKNGETIVTFFIDAIDTNVVSPYDVLAAGFAISEIAMLQEVTQVCGITLIYDYKGVTLRKLMQLSTPSLISMIVKCFQDRWPYRVTALHILNQPPYFKSIYELLKIMLSKKLRDRIFIHGDNLESLHAFIPPVILPRKLGGHLSDEIYQEFYNHLYENEPIFDVLTKYEYNGVSYGKTNADFRNS